MNPECRSARGSWRSVRALALSVVALAAGQSAAGDAPLVVEDAPRAYCVDEYAEDLNALQPAARELEREQSPYTFCVRSTATYECPSFGTDGNLKTTKKRVVAHGTAFAYRQDGAATLLLTNVHVSDWPAVTDDDHAVADVTGGCRKVADALSIVDNEADTYARDDIPLTKVVSDAQLDVSILRASSKLPILPWRIGRSAALKERDVVDVRGFPLGVLKATNIGKVVSAYDHDTVRDWDHDDFVVDALLSPGNSGSPVLAVSCRTGEFELVGIYHARYTGGEALNVVIGVDQVRDLMTTLKKSPRPRRDIDAPLDAVSREAVLAALAKEPRGELFFPFGSLTASVRAAAAAAMSSSALTFTVYPAEFPLRSKPVLVLADAPSAPPAFGALDGVVAGNLHGFKSYARAQLDNETLGKLTSILDELRRSLTDTLALHDADRVADASRERSLRRAQLEQAVHKRTSGEADLAQQAADLADRLGPADGDVDDGATDLAAGAR
jgi:serine protease Do